MEADHDLPETAQSSLCPDYVSYVCTNSVSIWILIAGIHQELFLVADRLVSKTTQGPVVFQWKWFNDWADETDETRSGRGNREGG